MKTLNIFFLHTTFLVFFACQSNDPGHQQEEQLRDSVMVVHDEVMPKMGEIQRLGRELKKLSGETGLDSLTSANVSSVVLQLEKADEGMMSWMAAFKQPSSLRASKTHDEIMQYLQEEMTKIEKVKTDMNNSIEAAKTLLEGLKK